LVDCVVVAFLVPLAAVTGRADRDREQWQEHGAARWSGAFDHTGRPITRRNKPLEPHHFAWQETLPGYFVESGKDYTRWLHFNVTDGDRFMRDATMDDIVSAVAAAPADVRLEFDQKLHNRLREAKPVRTPLVNVPTPEDMRESCKSIARWSDADLRRFREHFADTDQPILGMITGLCDEILRMRRDLRAVGAEESTAARSNSVDRV
jgi:hypothetical protein